MAVDTYQNILDDGFCASKEQMEAQVEAAFAPPGAEGPVKQEGKKSTKKKGAKKRGAQTSLAYDPNPLCDVCLCINLSFVLPPLIQLQHLNNRTPTTN